jgi:hypothetical protein
METSEDFSVLKMEFMRFIQAEWWKLARQYVLKIENYKK